MSASTEKKLRQAAREAGTDKKIIARQKEAEERAKSKRRWTLATVGIVLGVAIILLLNTNLIYKTTAYTVGDENYSASELSFYYANQYHFLANQYGEYASLLGLDTSNGIQGLEDQPCALTEGSWRDYLLGASKQELLQTKALCDYAAANGISLTEEELAEADAVFGELEFTALAYGFANADKYLAANYGPGVNEKLVRAANQDSVLANKAMIEYFDSLEYSEEELKETYAAYNGENDVFDYAYYYVAAETVETTGEDGQTVNEPTEETMAEAKAAAQAIIDSYRQQDAEDAAEAFSAAVAEQADGAEAVVTKGVGSGMTVGKEWMLDSARKSGDAKVVEDEAGCYALLYIARDDNDYNMAQVRHILVKAVADENGVYTDEAKAEAKAAAEDILKEFEAGDKSEESFAALAEQYSEDAGSNTNGGLYDTVAKGMMVEEFDAFCFEGHKSGDTAIVYGESGSYAGYHVMYYVGEGDNYAQYIARNDLSNKAVDQWLSELTAAYQTKDGFGLRFVG